MGVTKVEVKDYTITRYSFWKFWQVDELEFRLQTRYGKTRYGNPYEEVKRKTMDGRTYYSMELMDWVKDDIRKQLKSRIITYPDLVTKAKLLKVRFYTNNSTWTTSTMDFYIRSGGIHFASDKMVKRERLLEQLGI
jgi:hypothetical protein